MNTRPKMKTEHVDVATEPRPRRSDTRRRGFSVTPREAFMLLAGLLVIILIALVLYVMSLLKPGAVVGPRAAVRAGIRPLFAISGPAKGPLPTFSRPMGAAFGKGGRIYVADTGNSRICAFDAKGKFLFEFGGLGVAKPLPGLQSTWKPGKLNWPTGVATDEKGNVYVADFHNDQISVFTADGRFVRAFPDAHKPTGKGSSGQDGQGIAVTAVAARGGLVYATDAYQIFVFRTSGTLVRQFGMPGLSKAGLDHPNGIDVGPDGTIYVADSNHNRVSAFSPTGRPLWTLGKPAQVAPTSADQSATTETPGTFGLPRGVSMLGNDQLIVVDAFNFRLVRMSKDGKELARYGERGTEPAQMNFPNGIDTAGNKVVVADKENNRVIVVQLVGR